MAIREQIQAALGTLPGAEKKVAHAFLANYPSIGLSTIAELAALAGTFGADIDVTVRFVVRSAGVRPLLAIPDFSRAARERAAPA